MHVLQCRVPKYMYLSLYQNNVYHSQQGLEKYSDRAPGGGGGGTPLYKLYNYVPPQRVWFLSRFGLKRGIDFDHYGLKSAMVFKGTTGAYKRICLFNSK